MVLVCNRILQDHVTKRSCNFMGRISFTHQSAKFDGHRYCNNGDIMVLVCYVILQDDTFKGLCNFMDEYS